MKAFAYYCSFVLFSLVLLGALRTIFKPSPPFFHKFDENTRHAYFILAALAALLFVLGYPGLQLESVEVAGMKATVTRLETKVDTLSRQMEAFFARKKVETFDSRNWSQVRTVSKSGRAFILEVTLQEEPIPNSIEVFEGVLPMPEQEYVVKGRVLQFPANTNQPSSGLTVKYYPRIGASQ